MKAVDWIWADKDPNALAILESRIEDAGRNLQMITYSDLVKSVDFHLPNVKSGEAYRVPIHDWSGFDRGMVGEFLGQISTRSIRRLPVADTDAHGAAAAPGCAVTSPQAEARA